jgi:hypothetical protein
MMNFHHHRWGFPCCVCFPVCACCRHYPGRTNGSCSLVLSHPLRPSPRERRVGSCIALFEACSTFILVTACTLTESLFTTLYTEGSSDFVASTAASVVTGWNEPVPGRVYLPLKNTAFHGALSPLRFASVEMTKGRVAPPERVVCEQKPFLITWVALRSMTPLSKTFSGTSRTLQKLEFFRSL